MWVIIHSSHGSVLVIFGIGMSLFCVLKYVFWGPSKETKILAEWFSPNFCTRCGLKPDYPEREMLGTRAKDGREAKASRWEAAIPLLRSQRWCCLTTIRYGSSTALSQQRQRIKQHYRFMLATQLARLRVPKLSIRRVWCFHRRGQDSSGNAHTFEVFFVF